MAGGPEIARPASKLRGRSRIKTAARALALIALIGCRSADTKSAACPDCNVVLISLDTLRADHLGSYGYQRPTSPCLDRFAAQATVFEQSFSQATWTLPSHMSIFTSLHPSEHGVISTNQRLGRSRITLAEVLHSAGYATAGFTGGYNVSKRYGFDRGFDEYHESYPQDHPVPGKGFRVRELSPQLFDWLDAHRRRKFFLFVHSYDTHEPFLAHPHLEQFDPGYSGPLLALHDEATFNQSDLARRYRQHGDPSFTMNTFLNKAINTGELKLSAADQRHLIALYDNEIRFVDDSMCELLGRLDQLGLSEKTIVVVTSDHGEDLFERGQVNHGGPPYEVMIRVPLIIRVPGRPPSRSAKLAQGIDVAPSLLELLALPPQRTFSGTSLFPLETAGSEHIISQNADTTAIRTRDRKAIFTKDRQLLFDLGSDPWEKTDIAASEPQTLQRLQQRARETLDIVDVSDRERAALDVQLSDGEREALRQLGYDN